MRPSCQQHEMKGGKVDAAQRKVLNHMHACNQILRYLQRYIGQVGQPLFAREGVEMELL